VTIYLAVKDGMVRLDIQDNGIGFDVSDPKVSNGEGIAAMRERARQINATLSVISAPQQGARVHVLLSISNQAAQKSEG
jgi:signal transduction histidine kinase